MSRRVSRLHLKSSVSCSAIIPDLQYATTRIYSNIRKHFGAANSNYNTIMVEVCNICESIMVEFRLK